MYVEGLSEVVVSSVEVLALLQSHEFKTFIVSGGGIEFMRPWTERIYGIPPEQVIGSTIRTKFELRDGQPVLVRLPEIDFVDDKAGKPVAILRHIGRRPIAAFGNSDGDLQMLQWTAAGPGAASASASFGISASVSMRVTGTPKAAHQAAKSGFSRLVPLTRPGWARS